MEFKISILTNIYLECDFKFNLFSVTWKSGKYYTEKYKFNNIMQESKDNIGDNVTSQRPTRTFRVL